MFAPNSGFMAIWSNVERDVETDYLHWLSREHVIERVSVEGFLSGRVFRSQQDGCHVLFLYEAEAPSVFASPPYLTRLNNPTPWTKRIMPILHGFGRGTGRVVESRGIGAGGVIAVARYQQLVAALESAVSRQALLSGLTELDGVCCARLLQVDEATTSIQTNEKRLRASTDDASFHHLLVVECLDWAAAERTSALLPEENECFISHYSLIYALAKRDLAVSERS